MPECTFLPGPATGRRCAAAALAVMAGLVLHGAAAAQAASAPQARGLHSVRTLHWLAGCWHSEIDEPGSGEQWMAPAGGTMLGAARMLKGGRVVQAEFLQVRETATGTLVYSTHPPGQPGRSFVATEIGATVAVFENPGPDFPQRVIYRLQPDGRLAARAEGLRNGELRGVDFPMRRGACTAQPAPGG
ncbi:MAG: hypothetical protein JNL87_07445 [Burkholderiaceae bacterium]|nr:hypothetical protein [Burkholderiaceae bacterium]